MVGRTMSLIPRIIMHHANVRKSIHNHLAIREGRQGWRPHIRTHLDPASRPPFRSPISLV